MAEAVPRAEVHQWELEEFEKTLEPRQLERWRMEYKEWEEDKTKSNPFNGRTTCE
ncbi:hypothetical protein JVT61DRAFT_11769 [Boletus reticuloceps]|uniref:Uncharacterized protein n=1 Tax=Boletus reticuloceps TaxID=495285 RepID=A0A8I3ABJ2_9AGAM|nr:hypothetical protein JVT61DRAFT_11769 [Boletus reticuloceps]